MLGTRSNGDPFCLTKSLSYGFVVRGYSSIRAANVNGISLDGINKISMVLGLVLGSCTVKEDASTGNIL